MRPGKIPRWSGLQKRRLSIFLTKYISFSTPFPPAQSLVKRGGADSEFSAFESFAEPEPALSITLHVQARPWASAPLGVCLQQHISTPPSSASPYPLASHCISSRVLCRTAVPNCYSSAQSLPASSHLSPRATSKVLKALCLSGLPRLSNLRPYSVLLANAVPVTLASWAFLPQTKHMSASGPD